MSVCIYVYVYMTIHTKILKAVLSEISIELLNYIIQSNAILSLLLIILRGEDIVLQGVAPGEKMKRERMSCTNVVKQVLSSLCCETIC